MYDFIEWFIENRNKPLEIIVLAAFAFLIDRFGRKLITSQVKRLFHVDDKSEFKKYVKNQQRLEDKVDLLLQKEGITWNATISDARQQVSVTRSEQLLPWHSITSLLVLNAKKYIKLWRDHMSNINKKILIPLLSAIALFVKQVFGYEVPEEWINMGADIVLYLIMFAGLFIKPRKETNNERYTTNTEHFE